MIISHRFIKATIHTSDQPGPPLPYVGERGHTVKVSSGTSEFPMGNAKKQCVYSLGKIKLTPSRVMHRSMPSGRPTNAMQGHLNQDVDLMNVVKIKGTTTLIVGAD